MTEHKITIVTGTDLKRVGIDLERTLNDLQASPRVSSIAEPLFGQCTLVTGNLADNYRATPKVQYTAIIHYILY
jgi:hypothetical protein